MARELNDEAFDTESTGDLAEVLARYSQHKAADIERLKQAAVVGIIGGAKNYLDKIIKLQTKENDIGQNQTLVKLQEFVEHLHDNIQGKPKVGGRGDRGPVVVNTPAGGMGNLDSIGSTPSRNAQEQTQISVNSGGTEVAYHGMKQPSSTKSGPRTSLGKKKKKTKKEGSPLALAEEDLVNFVSKT